jgi:hypothetical protein
VLFLLPVMDHPVDETIVRRLASLDESVLVRHWLLDLAVHERLMLTVPPAEHHALFVSLLQPDRPGVPAEGSLLHALLSVSDVGDVAARLHRLKRLFRERPNATYAQALHVLDAALGDRYATVRLKPLRLQAAFEEIDGGQSVRVETPTTPLEAAADATVDDDVLAAAAVVAAAGAAVDTRSTSYRHALQTLQTSLSHCGAASTRDDVGRFPSELVMLFQQQTWPKATLQLARSRLLQPENAVVTAARDLAMRTMSGDGKGKLYAQIGVSAELQGLLQTVLLSDQSAARDAFIAQLLTILTSPSAAGAGIDGTLRLSGVEALTNRHVALLLSNKTMEIRRIDVARCPLLTPAVVESLRDPVLAQRVVHLDLHGSRVLVPDSLVGLLRGCTQLQWLNVRGSVVVARKMSKPILIAHAALQILDVSDNANLWIDPQWQQLPALHICTVGAVQCVLPRSFDEFLVLAERVRLALDSEVIFARYDPFTGGVVFVVNSFDLTFALQMSANCWLCTVRRDCGIS